MLTLGTFAAGATLAMGGKEKAKEKGPPINASSKDEEDFIQFVPPLFQNSLHMEAIIDLCSASFSRTMGRSRRRSNRRESASRSGVGTATEHESTMGHDASIMAVLQDSRQMRVPVS